MSCAPGWGLAELVESIRSKEMDKITAIMSFLAFGLFAFGARAADAITYLDECGNTCSVAAGACTLVTAATTELKDGRWYVVANPDVVSGGMTVSGSAQLILCDGMSLTVQGGHHQAGIAVPQGTSLSIYGQAAGTGVLRTTGGESGAGIGGGDWGACGTVTINGGRVTAKGGDFAAGIGGGYGGAGGTVTINGGALSIEGGLASEGIGCGYNGAGGTVAIAGGVFAQKPDAKWIAFGYSVEPNTDEATCAGYPWSITPGYCVTVGDMPDVSAAWTIEGSGVTNVIASTSFRVPSGATVTLVFWPKPARRFVNGAASASVTVTVTGDLDISDRVPKTVGLPVEYLDESGNTCSVSPWDYTRVTAATTELKDGRWYVVADPDVVSGGMTVSGSARLILCDGMSLTVQGDDQQAGIAVPSGTSLSIYGQAAGTGVLRTTGGENGAGIGGNYYRGNAGAVTINGGVVTATGGECAAGIGGGFCGVFGGAGGTVAINRGTVTAKGGYLGSGIGGGWEGAGGRVTIIGGALSTKGGVYGAGIGGGYNGAAGKVSILGGIFAQEPDPAWLTEGFAVFANLDEATSAAYPWTVLPISCEVTVGELKNMSAAWTSGDGSVTNAVEGTSFKAMTGETVTVLVSPKDPNCFLYGGEESYTFVVSGEDVNLTGKFASAALYLDANGEPQTRSDYTIVTESTTTLGDGKWYVVNSTVSCRTISVSGAAKLILGNGAVLAVSGGIEVESGASLTIYGQAGGAGFLDAVGGTGKPGIGGAGSVTIVGGTVRAQGGDGDGVPGIGANSVVIRGGSVGASVLNARDASGAALWRVAVEGLGTAAPTFADLPSGYGTAGISPVDGAVWLWLPNGTYGFKVNGDIYAATVKNAHTVATVAQWTIGADVTAAWTDGELTISGAGKINDFASADEVPWQGLPVANVTIPTGVKPGRNLLIGLGDTTTVNGAVPVSLIRQFSGDFLVGEVAPAEATALEIDGGHIRVKVGVAACTSLDEQAWSKVEIDGVEKASDGEAVLSVPVKGKQGFYRLRSK